MTDQSNPPDDRSSAIRRKAQLLSRHHARDDAGNVWATDKATGLLIIPAIYNVNGVRDEYRHLLATAPMAFAVINDTIRFLDTLAETLEREKLDAIVGTVLNAQAGLYATEQASLIGLKNIRRSR